MSEEGGGVERLPYEKPELTVHGSFESLTQNGSWGWFWGFGWNWHDKDFYHKKKHDPDCFS